MFVPVSKPLLGKEEETRVNDAITSGNISSFQGGYLKEFEEKFAKFVGVKHAIAVSSGTAALHLAVIALGLKESSGYTSDTIDLHSGDIVLFYTNALIEVLNAQEEPFSIERLHAFLKKSSWKSAQEAVDALKDDLQAFSGSSILEEEVTIVVLQIE